MMLKARSLMRLARQKPYIGIGSMVTLIVIGTAIALFVMQTIYTQQLRSWAQRLQDTAETQAKALAGERTSDAAIKTLNTLHDQLATTPAPTRAALLGLSFTPGAQRQAHDQLEQARIKLAATSQASAELVRYQVAITAILKKVQATKAVSGDDFSTLKSLWQAQFEAAQKVSAPQKAADFQAKLLATLKQLSEDASTLTDLHSKQDVAGFRAAKVQLVAHSDALRALGDTYSDLAEEQDTQLAAEIKALHSIQP